MKEKKLTRKVVFLMLEDKFQELKCIADEKEVPYGAFIRECVRAGINNYEMNNK